MENRAISSAAAALSAEVPHLVGRVMEQLHDPALLGDPALERSIELVLARLSLSVRLAKPIGLDVWAAREAARLGPERTSALAAAAAHVIASEAARFDLDQDRLLAILELLKSEIDATVVSCTGEVPAQTASSESTRALLALLGERDSATCCHSRATGEWARRLCSAMGIAPDLSAFIELCAVLHDIGKISTPESILFKRGPLTDPEWEIMRDHSAAGQRVLDQIPSLAQCSLIVRAHHERWDGAGYPDGLAGEAIPFEARVVAVADAFHAMISERPYRRAIAPRQALEILRTGAGTQWDAAVVDAMLSLFNRAARELTASRASTA